MHSGFQPEKGFKKTRKDPVKIHAKILGIPLWPRVRMSPRNAFCESKVVGRCRTRILILFTTLRVRVPHRYANIVKSIGSKSTSQCVYSEISWICNVYIVFQRCQKRFLYDCSCALRALKTTRIGQKHGHVCTFSMSLALKNGAQVTVLLAL